MLQSARITFVRGERALSNGDTATARDAFAATLHHLLVAGLDPQLYEKHHNNLQQIMGTSSHRRRYRSAGLA